MRRIGPTAERGWRLLAVVGACAALLGTAGTAAAQEPAGGACDDATARALVDRFDLNGFLLDEPVAQVLCGPFAGEGSQAMAMAIAAPTCWPVQRWAVLRYADGGWQLVLDRSAFLAGPLVAVGGDLRETTPVFLNGDLRCGPSGGDHARTWHWDGRALVPGPWDADGKGRPVRRLDFIDPKGLECSVADQPGVRPGRVVCQSVHVEGKRLFRQRTALRTDGSVRLCQERIALRRSGAPGRCGVVCGCTEGFMRLQYGEGVIVGRYRCDALRAGLRCTVAATGHGFTMTPTATVRL
jgi:hypothetical protein